MPAPPPESPKQPKHEHAAARQPELHPSASGFPGLPPAGRRSGWQIPPPTEPSASAHHPSCWAEAAATYGGAGASTPNLCRSATAASIAYASPLTGEQQQPAQPRRETRTSSASAQVQLDQRLATLKPRGRVQRAVLLSDGERHQLKIEQQRVRRARQHQLEQALSLLLADLSRFDLPLVQLLMAEFAAGPANSSTAGQMRWRFLELYGQTCNTKHAEPAAGVAELPMLAAVLKAHKPARELLAARVAAAKGFTAQSYSGGHRLGAIKGERASKRVGTLTRPALPPLALDPRYCHAHHV